ncbi:MAG: hypothetical protein JWN62_4318 [Acidimicrobiales bacterium]|nr:hypothetical protein [Acidimicrobiales bacterium]
MSRAEPVLSNAAAAQMATGVATLLDADVAVATTGVAGDEEIEGTPPGTVYIARRVDEHVSHRTHRFAGTPEEVCDQACHQALLDLEEALSRV